MSAAVDEDGIVDTPDVDATAEDPALSWVNIASKSDIGGCESKEVKPYLIAENCATPTNAHFYRNFVTSQPDSDIQLSLEDVGKKFRVVGFSANNF